MQYSYHKQLRNFHCNYTINQEKFYNLRNTIKVFFLNINSRNFPRIYSLLNGATFSLVDLLGVFYERYFGILDELEKKNIRGNDILFLRMTIKKASNNTDIIKDALKKIEEEYTNKENEFDTNRLFTFKELIALSQNVAEVLNELGRINENYLNIELGISDDIKTLKIRMTENISDEIELEDGLYYNPVSHEFRCSITDRTSVINGLEYLSEFMELLITNRNRYLTYEEIRNELGISVGASVIENRVRESTRDKLYKKLREDLGIKIGFIKTSKGYKLK